jgi:DNA invertase Pin-like site-specific DNA recombinase
MQKFVAYYRVSTEKQGRSRLGLDAQQSAVLAFLGDRVPVAEYIEVESGTKAQRPELRRALAECRLHKATLLIAKLDRLARNVAFISNLLESDVEFVACDFPHANKLTIHILAAVAEHEAHMISERTRQALASARKKGIKLGGFRGRHLDMNDRARARQVQQQRADSFAMDIGTAITTLMQSGFDSPSQLAALLNDRGIKTARGSVWQAVQVQRVMDRLKAQNEVAR